MAEFACIDGTPLISATLKSWVTENYRRRSDGYAEDEGTMVAIVSYVQLTLQLAHVKPTRRNAVSTHGNLY